MPTSLLINFFLSASIFLIGVESLSNLLIMKNFFQKRRSIKMKQKELKEKLKFLADKKIEELEKLSYQKLKEKYLDNPQTEEYKEGEKIYQLEIEGMYDDGTGETSKNIRVAVAVDDIGLLSACFPASSSLIVTPEGKFL